MINEQKKNDKFLNWMLENIPYYNELTRTEIEQFNILYTKVNRALEIETQIMDNAMNHNKAGINYSNDYEKALLKRSEYQMQLIELKQKFDAVYLPKSKKANIR